MYSQKTLLKAKDMVQQENEIPEKHQRPERLTGMAPQDPFSFTLNMGFEAPWYVCEIWISGKPRKKFPVGSFLPSSWLAKENSVASKTS